MPEPKFIPSTKKGASKKDGHWRIRYAAPDGKRRSITRQYKIDCIAAYQAERRSIELGTWIPPERRKKEAERKGITVTTYFERLPTIKGWSPGTVRGYTAKFNNHIKPELGSRPLADVTRAEITQWYLDMAERNKKHQKLVHDTYSLMRTIFNQAVEDELIDASPVHVKGAGKRPTRKKEIVVPSPQELAKIADLMPNHYRAAVMVAAYCSLRISEWSELRRKDVLLSIAPNGAEEWSLHVCRQAPDEEGDKGAVRMHLKAGGERYVSIPQAIVPLLQWHMRKYVAPGEGALLFPNRDGTWTDRRRFNSLLKTAVRKAIGREDMTSHDLRHFGATEFARSGASAAELQARLGHSTVDAAMTYQHAVQSRDRDVANRMSVAEVSIPAETDSPCVKRHESGKNGKGDGTCECR